MATSNKDFRVKNGLVVEGTTATVNGNSVLTSASSIDDLGDVNVGTPDAGDTLVYDGLTSQWIAATPGAGTLDLDDLGDVSTAGAVDGDALVYDSGTSAWLPGTLDLTAVTTSATAPVSPANSDLWLNSTNGELYIYYEDYDSGQWIAIGAEQGLQGPVGPTGPTGATGATGAVGPTGPEQSVGKIIAISMIFG